MSESVLVRLHYLVYSEPGRLPDIDAAEIEARIVEATRAWTDDLEAALVEEQGEERGAELISRYRDAFPTAYRADWVARSALSDIRRIEALTDQNQLTMSVFRPLEAPAGTLRAKLYKLGSPLTLSNMLPLFEDMGVEVADERPYEITPEGAGHTWIYDFGLHYHGEGEPDADGFARLSRTRFCVPGAAIPRATATTDSCWEPASPGVRSPCSAPWGSTCARPEFASATATWSDRWWATRRSPAC